MPDDREGKILSILLMDVLLIYFAGISHWLYKFNTRGKKTYQELNRKFPKVKPSDYLYSSSFQMRGIGSPIKHDAYAKWQMNNGWNHLSNMQKIKFPMILQEEENNMLGG